MMTAFPRHPLHSSRPQSSSSHDTSLTPSISTAPRESTPTPPTRTPSPYLPDPDRSAQTIRKHKNELLPSIRIDNGDSGSCYDHDNNDEDSMKPRRRTSMQRTRTWAEEVENNRNRTERVRRSKAKAKAKAINAEDMNSDLYGQQSWSVSTNVIDSLVEALSPSSTEFCHLPSAAEVIAANRRKTYHIDSDSNSDDNDDNKWWKENTHKQELVREKARSTSMQLEVNQPNSGTRERRKSEWSRKISKGYGQEEREKDAYLSTQLQSTRISSPPSRSSRKSLSPIPLLPSPTTPTTPITQLTPSTPAKTSTTPILSIDDIIKKHSPGITSAENVVKEKARKEIEEIRPRLSSIKPRTVPEPSTKVQKDPSASQSSSTLQPEFINRQSVDTSSVHRLHLKPINEHSSVPETPRTRRISFISPASQPSSSIPSIAPRDSISSVRPILRKSQTTQNTPQKFTASSRSGASQSHIKKTESNEPLSFEAQITSALLDQLEQLDRTSTINSTPSTPSSSRRISFQVSQQTGSAHRPMTPTNAISRLSKRKSMPNSNSMYLANQSPQASKSQAELEEESLSYAIYLRSKNLNRMMTLARPYPEKLLNVSFAEVGNSSGNPVIIFLGLGCVRYLISLFDDIAKTFNLRLICIDRWGYGKTDQITSDEKGRTPVKWSEIVEKILDNLNIREFQILAHSAGSPYALATAIRLKNRIKGKIHLLAPWISSDIDGGYKWLKYVPNTVIKSATAAEWKLQSYLIGKPPPLKHKPISHDASAPVESQSLSSPNRKREKRLSLVKSSLDLPSTSRQQQTAHQLPSLSQQPSGLVRRASQILAPRSIDNLRIHKQFRHEDAPMRQIPPNDEARPENGSLKTMSPLPLLNSESWSIPPRKNSENSVISIGSSSQTTLITPKSSISEEPEPYRRPFVINPDISIDSEMDLDQINLTQSTSEGFQLCSNSLYPQSITSSIAARSALLRTHPYTPQPEQTKEKYNTFSANSLKSLKSDKTSTKSFSSNTDNDGMMTDAPTGERFSIALSQASHAECEPGTTSDLLSIILNKNQNQSNNTGNQNEFGFSYKDYKGPIKIYYGLQDDKISLTSIKWLEMNLLPKQVELIIKENQGHNLMTSLSTMWEVFESLHKENKLYDKEKQKERNVRK